MNIANLWYVVYGRAHTHTCFSDHTVPPKPSSQRTERSRNVYGNANAPGQRQSYKDRFGKLTYPVQFTKSTYSSHRLRREIGRRITVKRGAHTADVQMRALHAARTYEQRRAQAIAQLHASTERAHTHI